MTVMFCLDKGIISPLASENKSFEDVKGRAFAGSDYDSYTDDEGGLFEALMVILFLVIIPLILILVAVYLI